MDDSRLLSSPEAALDLIRDGGVIENAGPYRMTAPINGNYNYEFTLYVTCCMTQNIKRKYFIQFVYFSCVIILWLNFILLVMRQAWALTVNSHQYYFIKIKIFLNCSLLCMIIFKMIFIVNLHIVNEFWVDTILFITCVLLISNVEQRNIILDYSLTIYHA